MTTPSSRDIPYEKILPDATVSGSVDLTTLISLLENEWIARYIKCCEHKPHVLEFTEHEFTYLYDQATVNDKNAEDRLIAGYGVSTVQTEKRDANRIKTLLGSGFAFPDKGIFDKGHVIAHTMGGALAVNLFPQRPELNRGVSKAGKTYRRMEKYAAIHPGTFTFSRLIYSDKSWIPIALEYGLLMPDGRLWVEYFEN